MLLGSDPPFGLSPAVLPLRGPAADYVAAVQASRRTAAAVLSVVFAFAPSLAHAAAPTGWDHSGYDAEDSFYNPHESVINAGTIGSLTRRWSVHLRKASESCSRFTAPVVAGGRVVATDQVGIAAYNFSSGARSWTYTWPDPADAETPFLAADGGTLIAATSDCHSASDPNGQMVALDLATGRVRWHLDLDMPAYTLVVDKGMAVISGYSESDTKQAVAYQVADGRVAWHKANVSSSGVSADGRLMLTDDHQSTVVDISTGAALWTKRSWWQAQAATPSADRFLVTDNATTLSAINSRTGAVIWSAPARPTNDLIATDGRRVYRSDDTTIEALNITDGRPLWFRRLTKPAGQPLRAGGLLYTAGPILSPATGTPVPHNPSFAGTQLITGGRLLTVTADTLSSYAS
jgi:outer membrane protein assembly factor BamB